MNKKICIVGIIALLAISIVVAIEPLPKGTCTWTRPATEYRPARDFTGIWCRMSNGRVECCTPSSPNHTTVAVVPVVIPEPVCHEEEICDDVCHTECDWILTCNHQCNKWYNWHWHYECEEVCHEECHTTEVCIA